ncbi:7219_t:CDS:2 [Racocetra persica]|uniref:7219_t:CDS:1 n=1 Tax=Racocetra persica TaxID=160502 RepID=A0ACA9LG75_9GLOM|nr:7219_t:CDS:2 [Racocetra persica]
MKKELNSRKRSKSYTPTPLSLGDVREVETSSLSPLRGRPLPPSRQTKSVPNTPLNNSYQSNYSPTSPTISETSEYSYENDDSEAEEVYYETIIKLYEEDKLKTDREITDLHNEIHRLEANLETLQTEGEAKENKLKETRQKLHQASQEIKLLEKEKESISQELNLTNADFLEKDEEVRKLTERLNKEIANGKSLVEKLETQQTLDYGILSRAKTIYLDHSRSDSTSSLSTRVQSPTLDLELALKTPKTTTLNQELKSPGLEESEKRLSTTFDNLLANINDYQQEKSQVVEISTEAFAEMEARIVDLTQEREAYEQRIQQQETMVQELAQKNILLQEQLATEQNQTKRVKDIEQSLLILNQNNLEYQRENNDLQEQLRQKNYQLQSTELKKANLDNFIKSLAEIFPLSETQKGKLDEAEEPDTKLLSFLKTNIFGGVSKLKTKIAELEEKQKQQENKEADKMKRIKELIKQILEATAFINEIKTQLQQTQQEVLDLTQERDKLTTERDDALSELQIEKTNHQQTQTELAATKTSRDNLQIELDQVKTERDNLKNEKTQKSATLEKAKTNMDELMAQVLDLRKTADRNERLEEENINLLNRCDEGIETIKEADRKLDESIEALQAKVVQEELCQKIKVLQGYIAEINQIFTESLQNKESELSTKQKELQVIEEKLLTCHHQFTNLRTISQI